MGKRYKKGNRGRKKKTVVNDFYSREVQLNRMVANFRHQYYNLTYPPLESEYDDMNRQRLEIKRLFDLQDGEVWKQSERRKRFYYKQLNEFKYYYVAWKKMTYYIYLEQRYKIPHRFCTTLSFFKKHNHDIKSIRFQL